MWARDWLQAVPRAFTDWAMSVDRQPLGRIFLETFSSVRGAFAAWAVPCERIQWDYYYA